LDFGGLKVFNDVPTPNDSRPGNLDDFLIKISEDSGHSPVERSTKKPVPMRDHPENNHELEVQRLFVAHIETIRGFVWGLLPDRAAVDDVIQETFLAVTKLSSRFESGSSFPKWACSIARFKVMEYRRGFRRVCSLSPETIDALAVAPEAFEEDPRRDHLEACLKRLPSKTLEALRQRYEGDHKPPQIAELLGWSLETVYATLSRARALLRDCIRQRAIGEGVES
jgi:RNA polymerase sigma-70 factor (ECF subfamily)